MRIHLTRFKNIYSLMNIFSDIINLSLRMSNYGLGYEAAKQTREAFRYFQVIEKRKKTLIGEKEVLDFYKNGCMFLRDAMRLDPKKKDLYKENLYRLSAEALYIENGPVRLFKYYLEEEW